MKNILITGGSRGLGEAIARWLSEWYGADAAIATPVRSVLDVTSPGMWTSVSRWHDEWYGVINVAGTAPMGTVLVEDPKTFHNVMETNLMSSLYGLQAFAHRLRPGGCFITVSSVIGLRAGPAAAVAYETSKAAQLALVRHAACRLAPRVRVNALVPGYIADTGMTDAIKGDRFNAYIDRTVPLGRMAQTEEIAHAAKFLLDNTYTTGTALVVDGGWLAR